MNLNNDFYRYYFERTEKKTKCYEIFFLEKKKSQPIQFLQHNFTSCYISFLFSLIGLWNLRNMTAY